LHFLLTKPLLAQLELRADLTQGGKSLCDDVTLHDFYVHVIPHIHSPITKSIRSSQALTSIADGHGRNSHAWLYI